MVYRIGAALGAPGWQAAITAAISCTAGQLSYILGWSSYVGPACGQ
jgi:hypothetical protein